MAGQERSNQYLRNSQDIHGCLYTSTLTSALINQGRLYFLSKIDTGTGERVYRFKTGSRALRIAPALSAGLFTSAIIVEAPTITAEGTAEPLRSYNRNFADDNMETKCFKDATYTGGLEFRTTQAGFGSSSGKATSGDSKAGAEYIFKANTEYIVSFTPDSGTTTKLICDMYEVIN